MRSVLYMPASNLKAIAKARTLPVDAVILDLEDAVAPAAKGIAREQACAAVREGGFGARAVIVRINGKHTAWHEEDLAAIVACAPDGVLVPKVDTPEDVIILDRALAAVPQIELWAMIETCTSLGNLFAIAALKATTKLSTFVLGANDLVSEMKARLSKDRAPLHFALSMAVTAGRANDLAILDGVHNDLDDLEGFERECHQGVTFGFDGKTLVHPKQIEPCNRVFAPSMEDIAWSRVLIAAFELPANASAGAIRLQGRMVERLHLDHARRVVAVAELLGGNR